MKCECGHLEVKHAWDESYAHIDAGPCWVGGCACMEFQAAPLDPTPHMLDVGPGKIILLVADARRLHGGLGERFNIGSALYRRTAYGMEPCGVLAVHAERAA